MTAIIEWKKIEPVKNENYNAKFASVENYGIYHMKIPEHIGQILLVVQLVVIASLI